MDSPNKNNAACSVCRNCENLGVSLRDNNDSLRVECDLESINSKCSSWLERCTLNSDGESIDSSETSGITESIFSETTQDSASDILENDDVDYGDKVVCVAGTENSTAVENIFSKSNTFGDVKMKNCKKIHLGNIIKIKGPVHVTQSVSVVKTQSVTNQIFLEGAVVPVTSGRLSIVDRRSWLAQPPMQEKEYLPAPAKFVIISHTASEEGTTQAENVYLIRLIQTFHVEGRKWSDIGYNFLIGSDGNTYEGRGWGIVGAHTLGYNIVGVGISFVGCFMNKLPPQVALDQAKTLIRHGVEIGAIDKDYFLVGHCQCCPTESPGRRLYEEIQTWEHWHNLVKS